MYRRSQTPQKTMMAKRTFEEGGAFAVSYLHPSCGSAWAIAAIGAVIA